MTLHTFSIVNYHYVKIVKKSRYYLDVDVVDAAADSDDDSKLFKFVQIFFRQTDRVPHQSSNGFVQNLK